MKNLKNRAAAFGLLAILGMSAISASASDGILVSDKNANGQQICSPTKDGIFAQIAGVLTVGAPMLDGIIIFGRDGILVSDKQPCTNTSKDDGIIIFGRDGILVSD